MNISTKFNIGDKVWILNNDKCQEWNICDMSIKFTCGHDSNDKLICNVDLVNIPVRDIKKAKHFICISKSESKCFKSKDDLINSLK